MSEDFATAMRRALEHTRAADPGAAAAIIQAALAPASARRSGSAPSALSPLAPGDRVRFAGPLRAPAALRPTAGIRMPTPAVLKRGEPAARRDDVEAPQGGRVSWRRHACAAGARDYRLFLPSRPAAEIVGLLVMLHGCTQSPEDFARGTRMDAVAEEAGLAVAYPAQTSRDNPRSCWNWFRPEDQSAERGEPAILASLAEAVAHELDLGGPVYAAGLSAGGAMAAILGATHPALFRAVGVHSGLPVGAAQDLPSALAAMRGRIAAAAHPPSAPAIVFHGAADAVVAPCNALALAPGDGIETRHGDGARRWSRLITATGSELWLVEGAGHAWSGGDPAGSFADPLGPDASREMVRFFLETGDRA